MSDFYDANQRKQKYDVSNFGIQINIKPCNYENKNKYS